MRVKPTIEELNTYAKIHQAYVHKDMEAALIISENEVRFDASNEEHSAAIGSFNKYLAFKNKQPTVIADLSDLKFEGLNLSDCDLTNVILTGTTILGCVFSNANLNGADLTSANIMENLFGSTQLKTAKFDKSKIEGCEFSGAEYDNATFQGVEDKKTFAEKNSGLSI